MQDGFRSGAQAAAPRSCGNRRFTGSPIDALVCLVVWRGVGRPIPVGYPVWLTISTLARLRVTFAPQRWPACRGDARRLRISPDVFEYLPDVSSVRNERDDAHLPTTQRAQEREHFVCTGDQHRPQVMRRTPGRHRLALCWQRAAQRHRTLRALPRAGRRALHRGGFAPVPPAPWQQPEAASSEPTHQSSGAGACAAGAPARQCGLRGLIKDRVAIPLLDTSGILIGYAGRVVDDNTINAQNPRYKFPGMSETKGVRYEFHKSEFLYHGHAIAKPVSDLVVVDGFTALWWLWQHGYQAVVGLMGSACSDTQVRLILERSKPKGRIWYFADGDPAGVKCAKDTLAMLATSRLVRLVIADGRQPTDFTEGELKKLMPF